MDKVIVEPCSRWITVNSKVVTSQHSLFCYADKDSDLSDNKGILTYFRYKNREYALEQFLLFGSMWVPQIPNYYDKHGNRINISSFDGDGDLYSPLLLECDEYGDKIRLWLEV